MTAQRRLRVIVWGAMERMCVAEGICFRSVRGRLVGSGRAEDAGASERSEMEER